jgi:hypothetical protein
MPDLKDAFDVFRGDLLYGHSRDRGTALAYLETNHDFGEFMTAAGQAGAWVTVDNFNVPLDSDYLAARPEDLWAEIKAQRDLTKQHLDSHAAFTGYDKTELEASNQLYQDNMKAFLKRLKQSRLSPLRSLDAAPDKLDREGWNDVAKNRYYLAIRRACKFGIEHVAANTGGAMIHFVLNRFDRDTGWVDLLEKKTVAAPTRTTMVITYSEIRYVYKNWNRFSTQIQFYRFQSNDGSTATSFPSCPAPWEDDSRNVTVPKDDVLGTPVQTISLRRLWTDFYGPKKAKAYGEMVESLKRSRAVRYAAVRMDVDNWFDLGNICVSCNSSDQAIGFYKRCVTLLRG